MKKKYIITFFLICIIIFSIIAYKKLNLGNNINSSDKNNILNISSYEAIAEIQVYSNKNTNKYKIRQQYIKPNFFKQEIIEPENEEPDEPIANILGIDDEFDDEGDDEPWFDPVFVETPNQKWQFRKDLEGYISNYKWIFEGENLRITFRRN